MAAATQHSIHASISGMPHGLGLLTTVASLPPKYRSRYLNIKTKCEIPLDLSVKPISPQIANDVPIATTFTEIYTEPCNGESEMLNLDAESVEISTTAFTCESVHPPSSIVAALDSTTQIVKSISPPLVLPKRKHIELANAENDENSSERIIDEANNNPLKLSKTAEHPTIKRECTPTKPIKPSDSAPRTAKSQPPVAKPSKNKATRKLKFDEETSSPVSGTIIRPLEDITGGAVQYSNGDIDPKYNIVEVTEETKAELAAIKNVIGDYVCKLCRLKFDDAFGLARHRCACIVLLEYRCPECGKQFNCPANLASHRRWHKPKKEAASGATAKKENRNTTNDSNARTSQPLARKKTERLAAYACNECGKKFKRPAYLRKHQLTHAKKPTAAAAAAAAAVGKEQTQTLIDEGISTAVGSYQSYTGSISSASSMHSYTGTHEDEGIYTVASGYEYDGDSMSDCSSSSAGFGRLQIVESDLTEEENIAAAALTNLRNCASVIQHTTLAH